MGLSYRAGGELGRTIERACRAAAGIPNLKPLSENADAPLFWKDPALVQGGLRGLLVMAILALYVVFMIAFTKPSTGLLAESTGILLGYPNVMAALHVVFMVVVLLRKKQKKAVLWLIVVVSLLAAIGSGFTVVSMIKTTDGRVGLGIQLFLFTVQSLCVSYLSGIIVGVTSTRFEERLTLVEVLTTNGEAIHNLRLLKTTDTECRFVDTDGSECLIPKAQILRVLAKANSQS